MSTVQVDRVGSAGSRSTETVMREVQGKERAEKEEKKDEAGGEEGRGREVDSRRERGDGDQVRGRTAVASVNAVNLVPVNLVPSPAPLFLRPAAPARPGEVAGENAAEKKGGGERKEARSRRASGDGSSTITVWLAQ